MLDITFYPQINVHADMEKTAMEEAVKAVLIRTVLVISKKEQVAYAGAKSEMEEGQTVVTTRK